MDDNSLPPAKKIKTTSKDAVSGSSGASDSTFQVLSLEDFGEIECLEQDEGKPCVPTKENIQENFNSGCESKDISHVPIINEQDASALFCNEDHMTIILPVPRKSGEFVRVKGEANQMSILKQSNLDPEVYIGPQRVLPEIIHHKRKPGRPPKKLNSLVELSDFNDIKTKQKHLQYPEKDNFDQTKIEVCRKRPKRQPKNRSIDVDSSFNNAVTTNQRHLRSSKNNSEIGIEVSKRKPERPLKDIQEKNSSFSKLKTVRQRIQYLRNKFDRLRNDIEVDVSSFNNAETSNQNNLPCSKKNNANQVGLSQKLNYDSVSPNKSNISKTKNFKIPDLSKNGSEIESDDDSDEIEIIGEFHKNNKKKRSPKKFNVHETLGGCFSEKTTNAQIKVKRYERAACSKSGQGKRGIEYTKSFQQTVSHYKAWRIKGVGHNNNNKLMSQKCTNSQNISSNSILVCEKPKLGSVQRTLSIKSVLERNIGSSRPVLPYSEPRLKMLSDKDDEKMSIPESEDQNSTCVVDKLVEDSYDVGSSNSSEASDAIGPHSFSFLLRTVYKLYSQRENKLNPVDYDLLKLCHTFPCSFDKKISIFDRLMRKKQAITKKLFVVMPDGTTVQVNQKERNKAVENATLITKSINKIKEIKRAKFFAKDGLKRSYALQRYSYIKQILKDCESNKFDPSEVLPDSIQLVESKLPLEEASNHQKLKGLFLFRQIFKSYNSSLQCVMCEKSAMYFPQNLGTHYRLRHKKKPVFISKANFNEKTVFLCVPSNLNDRTTRNYDCCFCNVTMSSFTAICDHYSAVHNETVRLVCESDAIDIEKHVYCSLCDNASRNFSLHLQHMAYEHGKHTYTCHFCTFCTSELDFLTTHIKETHMIQHTGGEYMCNICSLFICGRDRFQKHIMLTHAVQTGVGIWSCAKCFYPFNDLDALMDHVFDCPKLQNDSELAVIEASTNNTFYKCISCGVIFSSAENLKKHTTDAHGQGTFKIGTSNLGQQNSDPHDENSCFLCSKTFSSIETLRRHQHHLHMVWVKKEAADCSGVSEEDDVEIKQEIHSDETSDFNNSSTLHTDGKGGLKNVSLVKEFLFSKGAIKIPKGNSEKVESLNKGFINQDLKINKEESDASIEYKHLGSFNISLDELPDDNELATIGFPNKAGHFCHICDILIKNYRLYYLHMLNFHQLQKRFQCIITSCGKTFFKSSSFKTHAGNHNQMSEDFCNVCDFIAADDVDLQDHVMSFDHAMKYKKLSDMYGKCDPHNHRCKICQSWFGLFSTFVKHVEMDTHKYLCVVCGLQFVQPMARRSHIETAHPEVATICEVCGADNPDLRSLWGHLKSHNFIHECPRCFRRFLQKEQFDAHFEIHNSPLPCPWEGCTSKLITQMRYYKHLQIHTENRSAKCTICNKEFILESYVVKHMKIRHNMTMQIPSSKGPMGAALLKAYKTIPSDVNPQLQTIKLEPVEEPIDTIPPEMIQYACAGCMSTFETPNDFMEHICTGTATSDAVGQVLVISADETTSDPRFLYQTKENRTEPSTIPSHATFSNSSNFLS